MSKIFVADKLKIQSKQTSSAIALILILAVSAVIASFPTARSQSTPPPGVPVIPTYAFLSVSPTPIGVGQTVALIMFLDKVPPTAAGPYGDRWHGFTVAVTKPDGTTQTLGPFTSDDVGAHYAPYVPTTVGTYSFQFSFPGQRITGLGAVVPVPIDAYYQSSISPVVTLTVQQQQILPYPPAALPTGYWTRPINANNREWASISGNWLGTGIATFDAATFNATGNFNAYTTAPNSAHIVWTKPIAFGGLIGGDNTYNYYTGESYEPKATPPVIINGVLYYNTPDPPRYGFTAVDLRTGQTLWWQNSTGAEQPGGAGKTIYAIGGYGYPGITMGQLYYYQSPNQFGVIPYLWSMYGSTWSMYDAFTGNWILNLNNVTPLLASSLWQQFGSNVVEDSIGDLLVYVMDPVNNWLALWNSSKAIPVAGEQVPPATAIPGPPGAAGSTGEWLWRPPLGATLDWNGGIQWNVSIPTMGPGLAIARTDGNVILATTGNIFLPQNWQMEVGYSAIDGHVLWVQNRTTPIGSTTFNLMGPMQDGVYTEFYESTTQWFGFDVLTGKPLWGPTEPYTRAFGVYLTAANIAYGNLYACGYDGMVHAYNVHTGQHLWDYSTGSSGLETVYPFWPFYGGFTIADGKIFAATSHSHLVPLFRGARLYTIDANTGKDVWDISGWWQAPVVADGYMVALNGYDNQIYTFGKGQTATTVTAPDTATPQGTAVEIRGTVTDQSPGAKGTPAISDQDMSAWMEYQYMQQPMPDHAAGVPVTLTAVDSNHNTSNIGTATSDNAGLFHIAWTPPASGEYTIIATFGGSNSYFASSAETSLTVSAASPSSSAPLDLYIIVATIIIIIAIAIVGILVLRKRP